MSDIQCARDLVRKAESGLRGLMRDALAQERYRDVSDVAQIADVLADLLRRFEGAPPTLSSLSRGKPDRNLNGANVIHALAPDGSQRRQSKAPSRGDDYPRFLRDRDKLVKVGWSKKDRREYEHRAPREIVMRVAETLDQAVTPGNVFRLDKMLPLRHTKGVIPAYQAYLALAWFRQLGAVEERGKDGYAIVEHKLDRDRLDESWKRLGE